MLSYSLKEALQYLKTGNKDVTLAYCSEWLSYAPGDVHCLRLLAKLFIQSNQPNHAIPILQTLLQISPSWDIFLSLANCYAKLELYKEAEDNYYKVLQYNPDQPQALLNIGLLLAKSEQFETSVQYLEKFLTTDKDANAYFWLGNNYIALGNLSAAFTAFASAIACDPKHSEAYHNLGILYNRQNEPLKALENFNTALTLNPENQTALHMVNALSQKHSVQAPSTYIKELFDQYAEYYDLHMNKKLNYQVPFALRDAIARVLPKNYETGFTLDLGCGTGLCGIYFRDLSYKLIGIDLSEKMIAKARLLNAYDELITCDMETALRQKQHYYNIIIAGDVFVYCGALESIFQLTQNALQANGLFAFTCEVLEDNHQQATYLLQTSGRYCHATSYIHHLSYQFNFSIVVEQGILLREQEGLRVEGKLFILQRTIF